ncbi:MAG: DUF2190 family protein [Comamonadaceae bacterium]|nr:MAG: DUF2190 family protein [Comamonadaceae bacterium]
MGASSGNIAVLTLTVTAAAALAANRFVELDGTYPTAGGKALGVTRFDAAVGDLVSVDILGTTIAECGGAVAADAPLMVDAAGKVVTLTGSAKQAVGRALEAGAGDGAKVEILLIPSAGLVTA